MIRVNLPDPKNPEEICRQAAHRLQGARWDKLRPVELELAKALVRLGYLNQCMPYNGFVGKEINGLPAELEAQSNGK